MTCEIVNVDGVRAIVCSGRGRRPKCSCGARGDFQCDWKLGDGKTCDAYLCGAHATQPAPDKHLCLQHAAAYREWLAARRGVTG